MESLIFQGRSARPTGIALTALIVVPRIRAEVATVKRVMAVVAIVLVGTLTGASVAAAATIQLFGGGSAVGSVEAAADFENVASLIDNPYVEGGMSFTRVNVTNNNDGCGFAGCPSHPGFYPGFVGNYFYGLGDDGLSSYVSVEAAAGQVFRGLEFTAGTGLDPASSPLGYWVTLLDNALVSSGTFSLAGGPVVVGFFDAIGFDELRYSSVTGLEATFSYPAIDSVRADVEPVPEPGSLLLMATGGALLLRARYRRTRSRSRI